jgi:hypothetical protein
VESAGQDAALSWPTDGIGHDVNLGRHATSRSLARLAAVLLWGTSGKLMGSSEGGVGLDLAELALSRQRHEDPMPYPYARPARDALAIAVPRYELWRQVTPSASGAGKPQPASTNKRLSVALRPG